MSTPSSKLNGIFTCKGKKKEKKQFADKLGFCKLANGQIR